MDLPIFSYLMVKRRARHVCIYIYIYLYEYILHVTWFELICSVDIPEEQMLSFLTDLSHREYMLVKAGVVIQTMLTT